MFNIGSGELIIIALIAIVLFGKEDLPATLRKFTKGFAQFKKISNEAQRSWVEVRDDMAKTIREVTDEPQKYADSINEQLAAVVEVANDNDPKPSIVALPQIKPPEGNTQARDNSDHHHQERIAESVETVTDSNTALDPEPKPKSDLGNHHS